MSRPGRLSAGDWVDVLLEIWRHGQDRSMVGPGDPRAHLDLAARLASELEVPSDALDLGSGAGIPGLALAGIWPQSRWVLVDAAQRRVALLDDAVAALGWSERVTVVHGRAEDLGRRPEHREVYDLVTARSFGPPAVAAECGGAFVRVGGVLAVTEPPDADGSRWPADELGALGLEPLPLRPGLQRLRRAGALDERFPRRPGIPAKRPLF